MNFQLFVKGRIYSQPERMRPTGPVLWKVMRHFLKSCVNASARKPKALLLFFENIVGKGEIARKEQFLLFPEFSTL